jgi:hypothetical protein
MAWVGLVQDFSTPSDILFNEDSMMWLMRRTGWARTNIWHGNGRNDCAWLHGWLVRYTSVTFNVTNLLRSIVSKPGDSRQAFLMCYKTWGPTNP